MTTVTQPALRPALREPFRADIQGLRALAVSLVLVYHLWPDYLRGGYVGVDAFFVISGFLITNHLVQHPPERPRDVLEFWGRRIRRLLPASLLVIVVTVLVGSWLLPITMLSPLAQQAVAAALYVENWILGANSVDYLAAQAAPSALQHYWSLSVEEQFYLVWPLLIALGAVLARRWGRRAMVVTISFLVVMSFAVSVVWTLTQPSAAYFVTPTRLWELGAGGLVAVAAPNADRLRASVRIALAWVGLALIAVAALLFTAATPFPGYWALLPVVGTSLVLAARAPRGAGSTTSLLAMRPVQYLGDISYSVYLWHWPMIVIAAGALGTLTLLPKIAIVVGALVLAGLTKRFVEDPVRRSRWLGTRVVRTFALAGLATALVIASTAVPAATVARAVSLQEEQEQQIIEENGSCLGAGALVERDCGDPHGEGVLPAPANALADKSDAYADGCFADKPFPDTMTCTYGDDTSPALRIALVGNSHAAQWLPALQALAAERDAQITTFIASGCMPTSADVLFDTLAGTTGCKNWGQRVVDATVSGNFDVVVMSAATNSDIVGVDPANKFAPQAAGFVDVFQQWSDAGVPVLVIRDTPLPLFDVPQCVASHTDDVAACDGPRAEWEKPDPLVAAAKTVGSDVSVVDLNAHLCDATTCYSVLGGILVYFDYMHVGATFITTMAPYLADSLDAAAGR